MRRGAHRPGAPRCLDHNGRPAGCSDQTVALKEPDFARNTARRHFANHRTTGLLNRAEKAGISSRVEPVDTTGKERHGRARDRKRGTVSHRINPVCPA